MHPAGADPLSGRVLEGRYRIGARIAIGGMSTVYAALDERLDREVAVKVMAPSLSADPVFLDRFAREARTAAKLSHVNAVSVYDQGRDDGNVFLVMELVRGRTLRDLIRERGALSPGEAVSLMEPVLAALAAAHRAGLVHRDVKPENILLSDDGVVKVADFGLARAVESNASSTHTGLMMGTVAYSSPEQFRRGNADARSDVYSAGIVLFELLTGEQPHSGPDAMAVAYSHVHQDTAPPSSRQRGVAPALDRLVARVTARDPAQRPPDAAAFLAELHDVRRELRLPVMPVPRRLRPRPGALGAAGPPASLGGPGPGGPPPAPARVAPPDPFGAGRTAPDPHRAGRAGVQHTIVATPVPVRTGGPLPPAPGGPAHPSSAPSRPKRRRRWLRTLIGTLVLLLVAAGITTATWWYVAGRWASVPDVRRDTVATARSMLEAAGFRVGSAPSQASETIGRGTVISTRPPGGQRLVRGRTVELVASTGPTLYAVPNVTGRTVAEAVASLAALTGKGIRVTYTRRPDDHVADGHVISVSPAAGTQLTRTGAVSVVVSTGLPFVVVPTVTGRTLTAATTALTAADFKVGGATRAFSDTVPSGTVISQKPSAAAKVRKFSVVTLVVSKGVDLVTVPPIPNLDPVADAESLLSGAGLTWDIQRSFGGRNGLVVGIDPPAGTRLKRGSPVTLYIV